MTENDKRIYILAPHTVQVLCSGQLDMEGQPETRSFKMVAGRIVAQGVHVGRSLGYLMAENNIPYKEITTIVLSVRNTKELRKVSDEVIKLLHGTGTPYQEFHDTNPGFYESMEKVHTITGFGPVDRELVESAISHLELY